MLHKKYIILLSLVFIIEISLVLHIYYVYNIVKFEAYNIDIIKNYYYTYMIFIQLFYLLIFLILFPYKNNFLIKNTNLLYIYGGITECILIIIYLKI